MRISGLEGDPAFNHSLLMRSTILFKGDDITKDIIVADDTEHFVIVFAYDKNGERVFDMDTGEIKLLQFNGYVEIKLETLH